jgi:hypothetical protein
VVHIPDEHAMLDERNRLIHGYFFKKGETPHAKESQSLDQPMASVFLDYQGFF